ncbi:hypothetical protein ACV3R5_15100 [Clostridium perfringens]|uniref:Uncharacterized protein n=1 Tax=Clostridium perfringens TaxID=1502 RepID=A0A133MBM9_CLOPF|nr:MULTISPECIES: hypothetical protein [Clostridium]KXA01469.1 hypothetical protein HMPREF3222_03409 [Clostridium perfringens]MDK0981194.1 hypothetical protein [Clostridium perfringens]MDU5108606.1 hypothetical protein [Clostridium sp.]
MEWIMLIIFWLFLSLDNDIVKLIKFFIIPALLYMIWLDFKAFDFLNGFKGILYMIILFVPPLLIKYDSKIKEK